MLLSSVTEQVRVKDLTQISKDISGIQTLKRLLNFIQYVNDKNKTNI